MVEAQWRNLLNTEVNFRFAQNAAEFIDTRVEYDRLDSQEGLCSVSSGGYKTAIL
jgi:hypothetical protein